MNEWIAKTKREISIDLAGYTGDIGWAKDQRLEDAVLAKYTGEELALALTLI